MSERDNRNNRFPVLGARDQVERGQEYPASVSWNFVEPFARQVSKNHNQSLNRIAERGGLSPEELWCVAHRRGLNEGFTAIRKTGINAIEWLKTADGAAVDWKVR
jgi:hypothetical protein